MPSVLAPLLSQLNFYGSIAVQARQSISETNWMLKLIKRNDFILGVVGWADLRSPDIFDVLSAYSNQKKRDGVRQVLHDKSDDYFMLQADFKNGIAALREFNLSYQLLLYPKHIPGALQLVKQFPEQYFVVDHISKSCIRKKKVSRWKEDLVELAKHQNVYCELSAIETQAKWKNWTEDEFKPYLDVVSEIYGTS